MNRELLFIKGNLVGMNSSLISFIKSNPTPKNTNGKEGPSTYVVNGSDVSNIRTIIEQASATVGIRKKTHAKFTIKNVIITFMVLPNQP